MSSWRDRFNQLSGKTRIVVCRLFVHLASEEVAPLLGILNRAAREAVEAEGELEVLGEGLVDICQNLLQYNTYWQSAANEGNVFWDEGEAGDYVNELFTDSAERYLSEPDFSSPLPEQEDRFSLPITQNLVVMITVAFEGDVPELETDLASMDALLSGLRALINLHYQERLRAIQVHFSPAQLGDRLTTEQLLINFPELIPL
ncbi:MULTISPECIES: DUF1517 domain-containing protein [unclassified Coleofasciculus]|uniref:DUF1517 domain-containing protein n=1 Tax=unclassified Coleofasciculus TaxID=2692782 RepID=UPI001880CFAE|nr:MULTISPECIES: DUF1517 domain-containing protein [unclassified Coleofasciculus]MBE9126651.1 DUF1517 domain-containing protein [Coleofasciculus sp. LEGE 07081]MBE9148493.1 DUF1517 domain-containing protein [Coleofasciculus sp. LEGE 07092]